jgi:hypothetical protein
MEFLASIYEEKFETDERDVEFEFSIPHFRSKFGVSSLYVLFWVQLGGVSDALSFILCN